MSFDDTIACAIILNYICLEENEVNCTLSEAQRLGRKRDFKKNFRILQREKLTMLSDGAVNLD